ncbi:MAG: hypothetical protein JWR69_1023 [Pedosphaera sp.]|nr:hypothetical protein [Pedosphaera sp.]
MLVCLMSLTGCGTRTNKMVVDLTLKNSSTNALNGVELHWKKKGPYVPGGILDPGTSSSALNVTWPGLPDAKLTFVDYKTRKPYEIGVSFSAANEQVRAGRCHEVIIQILGYDKADVICK